MATIYAACVLLLVVLFIVVPIAEIYVIIQVGQEIGVLWTVLILIADSLIGARLLGWQGRRAWGAFQSALAAGRIPHREVLDGTLIILGGAFLLTPGFLTDVVGLLLLIPPTRAAFRRLLTRMMLRPTRLGWARVVVGSPRGPRPQPTARPETPAPPASLPPTPPDTAEPPQG
ncbi:MAG: FxsA family protein [Solirubrobacterales bacterium]